jgi:hypothetical protein
VAASKIGEALDATEVVSTNDGLAFNGRGACHRRLKRVRLLGAFGEDIKKMLAIGLAHAVLTCAQAVREMFVGSRGPFVT